MSTLQCRPLPWVSNGELPNCTTKEQMKKLRTLHIAAASYHKGQNPENKSLEIYPPCLEIGNVQIDYMDVELDLNAYSALILELIQKIRNNDYRSNYIGVRIDYWSLLMFKEIKQIRAYNLQSLIGNTGGYVGLLLGYTILELPFLIIKLIGTIKGVYLGKVRDKKNSSVGMQTFNVETQTEVHKEEATVMSVEIS